MNALTYRLLQVFQHVVDAGSVTAASTTLSLAQPTVSLQLKKLNALVGLPLLKIQQGKVHLTEAGEAVYQCAQEVLSAHSKLASRIGTLNGVETESLRLSMVTTAKYVMPRLIGPFSRAHPNVDVRFTVGSRSQIVARLKQNKDDLYIFSQPPAEVAFEAIPFMTNRLVVIAPPDYNGPNHCHLRDISHNKFLMRELDSGTYSAVHSYCQREGVKFADTMIIASNEAIRLAVSSGLGMAILSEHALSQTPTGAVKILTVTDFPLTTKWQAVSVRNKPLNVMAEAFRNSLISRHDVHST